ENKMFTVTPIAANSEKGAARLYTTFVRGERRVRSLNLPELGRSLIYEPLTKNEREILAQAGQVQAVPVIAARKYILRGRLSAVVRGGGTAEVDPPCPLRVGSRALL